MRRFTGIPILLCTLLLVSSSSAQQTSATSVPNLIRYGGTLKNAETTAISSATVGVTFSIYKQQDGGAAAWMETQNVTPDASGNYSVVLGSTTATGLPSDLFSQEEQRWLGAQAQGQSEQPRVLLVNVSYAFKAHDAETLAGESISDFVLAKDLNSTNSAAGLASGAGSTQAAPGEDNKSPSNLAASAGPTNFSGSTTDQIVEVTQSGTGAGVNASAGGNAVVGTSTASTGSGYGVEGLSHGSGGIGVLGSATSTTGAAIGVKGSATSTSGTGVLGMETATTGSTTGIRSSVASPGGIAALFNNAAGGKILSGQNNSVEKFSVDGSGNVTSSGRFTGSGSGLTGILFSQLGGTVASSQLSGTYSNALTLSNTANVYYGNGAHLTGVVAGAGSPYYIQNGTSQQASANFNISGNGTLGGELTANAFTSATNYQIGGNSVLSIGSAADSNLFLGVGAGANNVAGSGHFNVFSGYQAGLANTTGFQNVFSGWQAGVGNTTGYGNVYLGPSAGKNNTTGQGNTFSGWGAGAGNTGIFNTFYGYQAGNYNPTGSNNVYVGNVGTGLSESNTIRIGGVNPVGYGPQTAAYIVGIYNSTATPTSPFQEVCVDINGTLFGTPPGTRCVVSSRRFKEQILDMGDSSSPLFQLRPVTFFYKPQYDDGSHTLQYGLIAEEVAKVYPDMVAYDKDGQPYTVKYQYLAPMLLNELQKQHAVVAEQQNMIKTQQEQIESLQNQNTEFQQRLLRLESLIGR